MWVSGREKRVKISHWKWNSPRRKGQPTSRASQPKEVAGTLCCWNTNWRGLGWRIFDYWTLLKSSTTYNCTHCSCAYKFVNVFLYLSHSSVWRSCSLTLRLAPPEVKLLHDWDRRDTVESPDPNLMVILLPLISSLLNVPSAAFSADFLCVNCTKAQPWWWKKVIITF